jgi:hypothetical protein
MGNAAAQVELIADSVIWSQDEASVSETVQELHLAHRYES